ncbi:MAG: methyl-accepting chemotaxis protein [Planctomycetales bacterium]|nr:methyl-accepting chemotaxis protein [Planctomycetales bacterium]
MNCSKVSLRTKLLILCTGQVIAFAAIVLAFYSVSELRRAEQKATREADEFAFFVSSVRQEVASSWAKGLYSQEHLKALTQAGNGEDILHSVPIVASWRAAKRTSQRADFVVKTPSLTPRNPDNLADPVATKALRKFEQDPTLESHLVVDEDAQVIRHFSPIRLTSECLICHGDPQQSDALWGNLQGLDAVGYPMENYVEDQLIAALEIAKPFGKDVEAAHTNIARVLFLMFVLVGAGIGLTIFLADRKILRPIKTFVEVFNAFREGDLRRRLALTCDDEVGLLGRGINQLGETLSNIVTSIRSCVSELSGQSQGLNESASEINRLVDQTNNDTMQMAAAVEELSKNNLGIESSIKRFTEALDENTEAIQTLETRLRETSSNAEIADKIVRETRQRVNEGVQTMAQLDGSVDQVTRIIALIHDVAEQTNLLALNATIEAARAGDAGKGFAVVADEVKQLAGQTASATEEIRSQISEMQSVAERAIQQINHINDDIDRIEITSNEINEAMRDQKEVTSQLVHNLARSRDEVRDISSGISENAAASARVAKGLHTVNANFDTTRDSVVSSSRSLESLSCQLSMLMEHFQIEDTEDAEPRQRRPAEIPNSVARSCSLR